MCDYRLYSLGILSTLLVWQVAHNYALHLLWLKPESGLPVALRSADGRRHQRAGCWRWDEKESRCWKLLVTLRAISLAARLMANRVALERLWVTEARLQGWASRAGGRVSSLPTAKTRLSAFKARRSIVDRWQEIRLLMTWLIWPTCGILGHLCSLV